MFKTWVLTERQEGNMKVAVEFPATWSDISSQADPSQFKLTMAEGELPDDSFDAFAVATFPGIPEPAVTANCIIAWETIDSTGAIAGGNTASEIGQVDRDKILSFVNYRWQEKFDNLQATTSPTMTRDAFRLALLAAINVP